MAQYRSTEIEDYESLVGTETIQRIRQQAANWKGLRVANFNSTYYAGGVAETISSLTLLMNSPRTTHRVVSDATHTRFFSRSSRKCTTPSRVEKPKWDVRGAKQFGKFLSMRYLEQHLDLFDQL